MNTHYKTLQITYHRKLHNARICMEHTALHRQCKDAMYNLENLQHVK